VRIFRHYVHLPIAVLATVETIALLFIMYVAVYLRFDEPLAVVEQDPDVGPIWPRAVVFAVVAVSCLIATGLYSIRLRTNFFGTLVRIGTSVLAAVAVTALIYYIVPKLYIGRGVMAYVAALAFGVVAVMRFVFMKVVDEELFKRRVLVFGCGWQAESISRLRRRSDQRGFLIVGYVAPPGDKCLVPAERIVDPGTSLLDFARANHVDEVVIAMDDRRRAFPLGDLLECRMGGIDVVDLVTFLERETGKVRLDVLNPSWMIFSDGFRRDPLRLASERSFDILVSLVLLALSWPLMLLTALAIKLEGGWSAPVFYRQTRVGFEGRLFDVLKFRSMTIDAERDGQARWAERGDARITRVGAVIRKIRLDELPQVLNVLRGDMSFVGPRPERPEFVEELNQMIPYYSERHCVKPGITGWAQLCYPYGSSAHDAAEKLQFDLYYVKNHSLLFDVMILLQTAEVVLWGKGGR
jgi:sugar transferase (PEP-CTERM system associated)